MPNFRRALLFEPTFEHQTTFEGCQTWFVHEHVSKMDETETSSKINKTNTTFYRTSTSSKYSTSHDWHLNLTHGSEYNWWMPRLRILLLTLVALCCSKLISGVMCCESGAIRWCLRFHYGAVPDIVFLLTLRQPGLNNTIHCGPLWPCQTILSHSGFAKESGKSPVAPLTKYVSTMAVSRFWRVFRVFSRVSATEVETPTLCPLHPNCAYKRNKQFDHHISQERTYQLSWLDLRPTRMQKSVQHSSIPQTWCISIQHTSDWCPLYQPSLLFQPKIPPEHQFLFHGGWQKNQIILDILWKRLMYRTIFLQTIMPEIFVTNQASTSTKWNIPTLPWSCKHNLSRST